MPLEAPQLDTRTFDRLKSLALLRIPRYTPEWTDFNESDPGVTLVELFAWLTEMMLYEMNRIPDRNYIKFLQLLGMELRPAQPAVAYLTFSPQLGAQVQSVLPRSQISAQPPGGGNPLIFETTAGLDLIRLPLTKVQVFDGAAFTDVSLANMSPGPTIQPLGWVPQVGSALYLGFAPSPQAQAPFFPQEMRFRVFRPLVTQAGLPVHCADLTLLPTPPVILVWEYRQQASPPRWQRLNVYEDASIAFTREGNIQVEGPAADVVATSEGKVSEAMYWLRVRLAEGSYPAGRAPVIEFIRANVVEAENLSTIRDELVGISQGLPNQVFTLQHQPVWVPMETTVRADGASGALALWIQETGQTAEPWFLKPDLLASGPDDPHYVLNAATGEIRFGDGKKGRIPTAGAEIVARLYRYGGGKAGNVSAGLINAPLTVLTGVEKVTNDRPAVGGQDEQDIEEFKQQAPVRLRHRNRAVSMTDFAALAMEVGGIAKATAISLMHPDHRGVEVPGAITIVVVPDSEDVPPQPSQAQLEQVCRYLEPRRLLTTELYVKGPEYQKIRVMARVSAQPYAAFDDVARRVKDKLNAFLDPLGRAGSELSGADFGLDLFPTSLYAVILSVADVRQVLNLELTVNDQPHDRLTEAVKVLRDGLLYGALNHDIIVERFQDTN